MALTILLEEEYGYKYFLLNAQCTKEELASVWDKQKSKGCFYFDALGFFRKHKIPFTARPCTYGDHPFYGTGRFVLKEGVEDNDMVGSMYDTPQCWESAKGLEIDCFIHLAHDDDSGISFTSKTL